VWRRKGGKKEKPQANPTHARERGTGETKKPKNDIKRQAVKQSQAVHPYIIVMQ